MAPGPIPKRSEERTRRNKPGSEPGGLELKRGESRGFKNWPAPDPTWHPLATKWFLSLRDSGMRDFYEESDIVTAQIIAHELSLHLSDSRPSAMRFDYILKHMGALGTTEGERRRMRIELVVPEIPEESAGARAQRMWQNRLTEQPATVTVLHPEGVNKGA